MKSHALKSEYKGFSEAAKAQAQEYIKKHPLSKHNVPAFLEFMVGEARAQRDADCSLSEDISTARSVAADVAWVHLAERATLAEKRLRKLQGCARQKDRDLCTVILETAVEAAARLREIAGHGTLAQALDYLAVAEASLWNMVAVVGGDNDHRGVARDIIEEFIKTRDELIGGGAGDDAVPPE